MATSVIGYPRIGNLRELKFASEKYFKNEITASQLETVAKSIREYNLGVQVKGGIDYILQVISLTTMQYSTHPYFLMLSQRDIRTLSSRILIHTLLWQEDIRVQAETLRLLQ